MDNTSTTEFVKYASRLKGDEKSESQVFLEHLFQAFGHSSLAESGIILENRVKKGVGKGKKFADLVWPGKVLIEMKSRGQRLERHYRQVFDYWVYLTPHRPRWVILCNFDEFWIYDFDVQVDEPLDKVSLLDLPHRGASFSFLKPTCEEPVFGLNRVQVTKDAADLVANTFNSLIARGIDREQAQRFILQCVVCLFSEDLKLLPDDFFTRLLSDCLNSNNPPLESFEKLGGLFRQMNDKKPATGGRYKGVKYFNGGLFAKVEPLELSKEELTWLFSAAEQDWSKVNPAIFGTIFQHSMDKAERHAAGAHYTSEADIMKVVNPTIVKPWRKRLEKAYNLTEFVKLWDDLTKFKVLDPACGSGNFLYVAFRELKRVETDLIVKMRSRFPSAQQFTQGYLSAKQFYGFDILPFAVELAKVTLLLAKELGIAEANAAIDASGETKWLDFDPVLPLDNLDNNIRNEDALFSDWPEVDVIIGNPPYQSKNKMAGEFGREYLDKLHALFPKVPGRADYCVFFFRKAHDELKPGGRAGLVGTNTIRQNFSRHGGLDYIVSSGGTITDAVSTQVWSGEAAVHVSIVNWIRGEHSEKKLLSWQKGDSINSPWENAELDFVNSSLSPNTDVGSAKPLKTNAKSQACYQGQTHGHEGFLVDREEAEAFISENKEYKEVLFPFLIGNDLLGNANSQPSRYVIDFGSMDIFQAQKYKWAFERIKQQVLPKRDNASQEEERKNAAALEKNSKAKVNHHHKGFLSKWWQLSFSRQEMMRELASVSRYVACVRATKRPIFVFLSPQIHPNDALQVFPLEDDYSFGIFQSDIHWKWFVERCSTLKREFRYTSDTVFDSFPWPQDPTEENVKGVAEAAKNLREIRTRTLTENNLTLRSLYTLLETPGKNALKSAHVDLSKAVKRAYGMSEKEDVLAFLLDLNLKCAEKEDRGETIVGPGLPSWISDWESYISTDCIRLIET
jgi:type II restriction/modification system DNA methylase subunit YeeA